MNQSANSELGHAHVALGHSQRIRIIDIIRGFAVLGIFTMNAADMAYPQDLVLDFHAVDPAGGWNYWTAFTSEVLFSGKMRGLFTLLFGVSSVLVVEGLIRKTDEIAATAYYFRRLLWLLAFGLANAYILLWWGDILFKYALLGILLFPFRRASNAVLVSCVLICLAALTVPPYMEYREAANLEQQYIVARGKQDSGRSLTRDDNAVIGLWQLAVADAGPDNEWIEEEIQVKAGAYLGIFEYNASSALEEQTSIFYAEDIWDMLPYMFLGIMLLRVGFFDDRVSSTVHLAVALAGIGLGLAIHLYLNLGLYENFRDPVRSLFYLTFFDFGRVPFVLGYASLIILIFRLEICRLIGNGIEAVGRMALSNYLMQSVIGAFVFYGFGLAQFNLLSRLDLAAFIVLVWVFQLLFSVFWMRRFCYGPAEWLWRSLTYWKAQPLFRTGIG